MCLVVSCAHSHSGGAPRQSNQRELQLHLPATVTAISEGDKRTGQIMGKHKTVVAGGIDRRRLGGGLVIGALASGALAVGALSSAGQADASCVSAGGWFSIGSGCTTTAPGDFALAIGEGATATADGGRNTAISIGTGATSSAVGYHNTAIAIGDALGAGGGGTTNNRAAVGMVSGQTVAIAGGSAVKYAADGTALATTGVDSNNTAIAIGGGARATAAFGNNNYASAVGEGSIAGAGRGNNNRAIARGVQAEASAIGGDNNTAIAVGDPVAPSTRPPPLTPSPSSGRRLARWHEQEASLIFRRRPPLRFNALHPTTTRPLRWVTAHRQMPAMATTTPPLCGAPPVPPGQWEAATT